MAVKMATSSELPPTVDSTEEKSSASLITDGILSLIGPSIENLDSKVLSVKRSQEELSVNIDAVAEDLKAIADEMPNAHDLDVHIKRLTGARRKINVINSILHNCQDRLRKLHTNIQKETQRKEALLKHQQAKVAALGLKADSITIATDEQPASATEAGEASTDQPPATLTTVSEADPHDSEMSSAKPDGTD